jgi:hypothetical protein
LFLCWASILWASANITITPSGKVRAEQTCPMRHRHKHVQWFQQDVFLFFLKNSSTYALPNGPANC